MLCKTDARMITYYYDFFYLGFNVTFNTVHVLLLRVVLRAEETRPHSWSRMCTVRSEANVLPLRQCGPLILQCYYDVVGLWQYDTSCPSLYFCSYKQSFHLGQMEFSLQVSCLFFHVNNPSSTTFLPNPQSPV